MCLYILLYKKKHIHPYLNPPSLKVPSYNCIHTPMLKVERQPHYQLSTPSIITMMDKDLHQQTIQYGRASSWTNDNVNAIYKYSLSMISYITPSPIYWWLHYNGCIRRKVIAEPHIDRSFSDYTIMGAFVERLNLTIHVLCLFTTCWGSLSL